MINAVIIDDEKDARFLLRSVLEQKLSDDVKVVGEADDVKSGIYLIQSESPDLVFLDVRMKTGTGFDLLNHFSKVDFHVIFVTAYDQFAVEAFKFSAFDYILKPFKGKNIVEAVEKLKGLRKRESENLKKTRVLIENYGANGVIQKLIINNIDGFEVLEINDILRLDGDRNYTHFILIGGRKVTTSKSIGEYEQLLVEHGFYRIHQSTIVSLRHVVAFKRVDDGYVELKDGAVLKVSRNRKQGLISKFS